MSALNWTTIFRDAVSGVAGVTVYDKGDSDSLGRYVVAKTMKLTNGRTLLRQCDYKQRPAALRYAAQFLKDRALLFRVQYVPGDGVKTWGFKPICATTATAEKGQYELPPSN